MFKLFPILINIKGKKCVVIGGGSVAERKLKSLLRYGAKVILVSPEITNNLKKMVNDGKIEYIKKEYRKEDIKDAFIVVAATSNKQVNFQITKDAKFLINSVDEVSDYNTEGILYTAPAVFKKGSLTIAVSTEFPALSRVIRDEISKLYGKNFALYLRYLKKLRKEIQRKILDSKRRKKIFREVASEKIVSVLQHHGFKEAKKEIDKILNEI